MKEIEIVIGRVLRRDRASGMPFVDQPSRMSGCLGPLEEISRHKIEQLEAVAIVSTALRPDQSKC
jgi:hypothetical protein